MGILETLVDFQVPLINHLAKKRLLILLGAVQSMQTLSNTSPLIKTFSKIGKGWYASEKQNKKLKIIQAFVPSVFTKSVCLQDLLMCRNFEITALNVSKWKCLSQRIITILLFFQDLRRGRRGREKWESKWGIRSGCQELFLLIEDQKLLVRFSGFVGIFSYPKHTVYQC